MRRLAALFLIAFSFVWFASCRKVIGQQIIGRPFVPISGDPCVTCTQYTTANTVTFAGGVDMAYTNTAVSGCSDSKSFTIGVWLKRTSAGGTIFEIDTSSTLRFALSILGTSKVRLDAFDSSGNQILQASTANAIDTNWHHIYTCVNLSDTSKRHIYIDGVDQTGTTWTTYTDAAIDFVVGTTPRRRMANNAAQNAGYNGAMAEFWFKDSYIDSPCLLYCSGHPATIGATGQLADGSSPVIYLSKVGDGANWRVDSSGNGNSFSDTIGSQGTTTSP